jgi:hypothetical protein
MKKIVKHITNLGAALAVATSPVLFGAHPAEASTTLDDLANFATGRCLDDSTAYGLRGFSCNNSSYQFWWSTQNSNGTWTLRNDYTGRCLDDSTAYGNDVLRGYSCNGLAYQQWTALGAFTYRNLATGRCLDDSTAYGNDVLRGYSCNGSAYQHWV